MSPSSFVALDAHEPRGAQVARWRHAASAALHLGFVALAAVTAGLYIFPLY